MINLLFHTLFLSCFAFAAEGPLLLDQPGLSTDEAVFSSDGKILAVRVSRGRDNMFLQVWSLGDGKMMYEWGPFGDAASLAFSPGAPIVAAAVTENYTARLKSWRVDTGKNLVDEDIYKLLKRKSFGSNDLNYVRRYAHPGGLALSVAVPDSDKCFVFQMDKGKKSKAPGKCGYAKYEPVSPDGSLTAIGALPLNMIVSDVVTGKKLNTLLADRDIDASTGWKFSFSQDNRYLASCDNGVGIWDLSRNSLVRRLGIRWCKSIAVSAQGLYAAAAGDDDGSDMIRIWRVPNGKLLKELKVKDWPYVLGFSPDGKRLALNAGSGLQVWDMEGLAGSAKDASDKEIDAIEAAIKAGKGDPGAMVRKGSLHLGRGELDAAAGAFSLAIEAGPNAAALGGRAQAHLGLGDPAAALKDLLEAVKLEPRSARLRQDLGLAYGAQGRHDQAIGAFTEALKLDPSSLDARLYLGISLYQRGRFKEADEELSTVLKANPRSPRALLNRGLVRQSAGRKDALADFDAAIAADAGMAAAYHSRGVARMESGDENGAVEDLNRSMELELRDFESAAFLGRIHYRRGDLGKAGDAFYAAIKRSDGKCAEAEFGSAVMAYEGKSWTRAELHLENAVKLDPGNALYADWLKRAEAAAKAEARADVEAMYARRRETENPAAALSAAIVGIARGIAAGVNTSGSYSGSSGAGSSYSAARIEAAPSPGLGSGNQSTTRAYNDQVRRNVERKLWDMNNPYRINR